MLVWEKLSKADLAADTARSTSALLYEFTKVLKEVGKDIDKPKKQKSNQTADLEKFKKQCEDLGFKPKTEKFGECVLRLLEASN